MSAATEAVASWILPLPAAQADGALDCQDDNVLILLVIFQSIVLISLSHFLHKCILRHLGQPSAISQMLAGFLIGPSVLGQLSSVQIFEFNVNELNLLSTGSNFGRILFMFLIGLEMDITYILRAARRASIITAAGFAASSIAAAVCFMPVYRLTSSHSNRFLFFISFALIFSSTASPIIVRVATEMKLSHSAVGRLAVAAALINDTVCLLSVAMLASMHTHRMSAGLLALVLLAVAIWVFRPVVAWLNKRNEGRRTMGHWETGGVVLFVAIVAGMTEAAGYNSTMASFMMGMAFPREGCVARTLMERLTYAVNNFVLPVFFGYMGAKADVTSVGGRKMAVVAAIVTGSSVVKVAGTAAAAWYLGMMVQEGMVLGFLLNIKGHVDLLLVATFQRTNVWGDDATKLMLVAAVCHMLTAAPIAAAMVKLERRSLSYAAVPLELLLPTGELRILICVHGTRDVPTMLNLVELAGGSSSEASPVDLYLLHLFELTKRVSNHMLYHQQDEGGGYGWDNGGDDARVIAAAADVFRAETGITVHQVTAVSSMDSMHLDIHNATADIRASLLLLPFHKHQRVDGRMQASKKAVRSVNNLALRHAPCTAAVLVDRGLTPASSTPAHPVLTGGGGGLHTMHHVAVLFFGGGDDREALALGLRLSLHPCVSLTVVRFLPASKDRFDAGMEVQAFEKDRDVLLEFKERDEERQADEAFFSDFINRYVVPGHVSCMEKHVEDGSETVTALCSIEGMFALYLVGKGANRGSPLTAGMSDWEECPELGPVADFLASTDFMSTGSVLVLQRCNQNAHEF